MVPQKIPTIDLSLVEELFTLDVTRWSDEPVPKTDRVLFTDRFTGRSLVARAPLRFEERVHPA
jgi:hypothetical protein